MHLHDSTVYSTAIPSACEFVESDSHRMRVFRVRGPCGAIVGGHNAYESCENTASNWHFVRLSMIRRSLLAEQSHGMRCVRISTFDSEFRTRLYCLYTFVPQSMCPVGSKNTLRSYSNRRFRCHHCSPPNRYNTYEIPATKNEDNFREINGCRILCPGNFVTSFLVVDLSMHAGTPVPPCAKKIPMLFVMLA